jgi:hypothetical protein
VTKFTRWADVVRQSSNPKSGHQHKLMRIKGTITITRPHGGNAGDYASIRIQDDESRIHFVEVEVTLHGFAEALLGLGEVPMEADVRGLEYVGKTKVTETRQIVYPLKHAKREEMEEWLGENAKEDGWLVSTYLGARGSTSPHPDGQMLHYHVTKYVEPSTSNVSPP